MLNDDWSFSVTGIVGAAKFRATLPDGWMVKSILQNGRDVTDAAVEMKGGETLSGVQVIVTNRITTVTAEITDSKGALLTDGTLVLFASDATMWGEARASCAPAAQISRGSAGSRGCRPVSIWQSRSTMCRRGTGTIQLFWSRFGATLSG